MQGALEDALVFGNEIADAQNDKALAALHLTGAAHIHNPTPAQTRLLKNASKPVHAELAARIGQDWLRTVQNALPKGA